MQQQYARIGDSAGMRPYRSSNVMQRARGELANTPECVELVNDCPIWQARALLLSNSGIRERSLANMFFFSRRPQLRFQSLVNGNGARVKAILTIRRLGMDEAQSLDASNFTPCCRSENKSEPQ